MRDFSSGCSHLAINSATVKQWSIERLIEECARRGIPAVALWHEDVELVGVDKVRRALEGAGVGLSGYCRAGFFPFGSQEEKSKSRGRNELVLEFAAALGSPSVAIVAGGLATSGDRRKDVDSARAQIVEGLASLLEYSKPLKMPLAIEPLHPMYAADRACINTLQHALDICDELDPQRTGSLGVAVDCYHVWWDPQLKQQIARAGKDRILGFHICDWLVPTRDMLNDRGMMGDGVIDIPKIRAWVEKTGFEGFAEVEIFSAADWWLRDGSLVLDTCVERYQTVV